MQKDSAARTILVAVLLCLVCSVLVTSSAVVLRDRQVKNEQLDIKKNLLFASGILKNTKADEKEIIEAYKVVKGEVIDLSTGSSVEDISLEEFDQRKMSKDPDNNHKISLKKDIAGIKFRSKYSVVYHILKNNKTSMIVLPINGKGLWSTLYGFIALAPDTRTIKGIGFYEHAETPGLGGEIDNALWKKQWIGKIALNDKYEPVFEVNRGLVTVSTPNPKHKVDGLSGATITSNGVTNLVKYWLGEDGFGPYLSKFRASQKRVKT